MANANDICQDINKWLLLLKFACVVCTLNAILMHPYAIFPIYTFPPLGPSVRLLFCVAHSRSVLFCSGRKGCDDASYYKSIFNKSSAVVVVVAASFRFFFFRIAILFICIYTDSVDCVSTDLPHGQCKFCGNISFHSRSPCLFLGATSRVVSLMPQIDAVPDYTARCGKLYRAAECRERERENAHRVYIGYNICEHTHIHTHIYAQRESIHTHSNRSKIHSLHHAYSKWENTWTKCMTEAFLKLNSLTQSDSFIYLWKDWKYVRV